MKKSIINKILFTLIMVILTIPVVIPLVFIVMNSFMSPDEILLYHGTKHAHVFHIIPDSFSLQGYYEILVARSDYLIKFWNSMGITLVIVCGQTIISVLAGYAFAKFEFPCKNILFFLFIIFMMMPYQVTLVSNYIVLDKLNWIGSYLSVVVPGIFAPFGIFLITQIFKTTSNEIIEAAKIDGASQVVILYKIMVPCNINGIISLFILSFIDNWNMVEQPLIFLKEQSKYPLSIFLAQINEMNMGVSFSCGILALLPVTLLFVFFDKELVNGISFSGIK